MQLTRQKLSRKKLSTEFVTDNYNFVCLCGLVKSPFHLRVGGYGYT